MMAKLTAQGSSTIQITSPERLDNVSRLAQVIYLKATHKWLSSMVYKELRYANDVYQRMAEGPLPVALYSDTKQILLSGFPKALGNMQAYSAEEIFLVSQEAAIMLSPSEPVLRKMTLALAEWFGGETGPKDKTKGFAFTTRKGNRGATSVIRFRNPELLMDMPAEARRVVVNATLRWAQSNDSKARPHTLDPEQQQLFETGADTSPWGMSQGKYLLMCFVTSMLIPTLPLSEAQSAIAVLAEHVSRKDI